MKRAVSQPWLAGFFAALCILSSGTPHASAQPQSVPDMHKLLKDPSPTVRLSTARALAEINDAEAIPVLIELLEELPAVERDSVEEFLTKLAGEWAPTFPSSSDDRMTRKIHRASWMAWWRNTDGDSLLAIVRQSTLTPKVRRQVKSLLGKLGDDDFPTREAASEQLCQLGRLAVPQLREIVSSKDLEVARRARQLIEKIEQETWQGLPAPTMRLLALRKPPGAAEVLLDYFPLAEEEYFREEITTTLAQLAVAEGKLNTTLVRALGEELPQVRSVAAVALVRGGGRQGRTAARKLLKDDSATVRLEVALAFTSAGNKEGVPVLIDLLAVLPDEQVGQAEDALYQLAGDTAPELSLGTEAAERKKCRDAWAAWWERNAPRIELNRLADRPTLGYTLICNHNSIVEVDRRGKRRWRIDNLNSPTDARILPGQRILIAECGARRVVERDLKGNVLWTKAGLKGYAANVQRLANGNTFIALRDGAILEVDRAGKEVYQINNVSGVLAGYRSRQGILCVTLNNRCLLLDTTGKQLKSFDVKYQTNHTGCLDVLPDGRLLIASHTAGRVMEYDVHGKLLREWAVPGVDTATGLPNGHILACSRYGQRLVEMDRTGRVVWEQRNFHPYRARRR